MNSQYIFLSRCFWRMQFIRRTDGLGTQKCAHVIWTRNFYFFCWIIILRNWVSTIYNFSIYNDIVYVITTYSNHFPLCWCECCLEAEINRVLHKKKFVNLFLLSKAFYSRFQKTAPFFWSWLIYNLILTAGARLKRIKYVDLPFRYYLEKKVSSQNPN